MTNPKLDHRRVVEHILEDTTLTSDLIDDAAKSLLDWGITQANAITEQAEKLAQGELDAHLTNLRRAIKRINRQAGQAPPEAQVERVQTLLAEIKAKQDIEVKNAS